MIEIIKPYLLTFILVFVAANSIGVLPIFISLTEGMTNEEKRKTIYTSVLTASIIALLFLFLGKAIFLVMGITIPDFKVAGGILLFVISVNYLLPKDIDHHKIYEDVGAFPLGTPLITGPAVLTTLLVSSGTHGFTPTIVALVLNMLVILLIFRGANFLSRVMGKAGMKAFSKIAYILLASIAIKMIRSGIDEIIKSSWH
jgi:multiple antibiotic resistance protein